MNDFDQQIKKKNELEDELFAESYQKLAEVVTGKAAAPATGRNMLLDRRLIEDIAARLGISVPYASDEKYTLQYYLDQLFRPRGVMWRDVILRGEWYNDAMGVMLASLEDGRRVVLTPHGMKGYTYNDPDTGKKTRVTSFNAGAIAREATLFYKPLPQKKLKVRDILVYISQCVTWIDVLLYAAATVAVILLSMVTPAMTKVLFSTVIETGDNQLFISIFILLVVTSLSTLIFEIINKQVLPRISYGVAVALQAAFMMRTLSAPVSDIQDFSAGDLGARLGMLYNQISVLLSDFLSAILTTLCSLLSFFQMFGYSPTLGAAGLVFATLLSSLYIAVTRHSYDQGCASMDAESEESGLTFSLIDGIEKIAVSGAEKRAFTQWSRVYRKSIESKYNTPVILKVYSTLSSVLLTASSIVMLALAWRSGLPTATYYSFIASFGIVTGALSTIGAGVQSFGGALPVFRILRPIMDMVPELKENKEIVKSLRGDIRLEHVTFGYADDQPPVIDDLSMDIREGQYVAIVGTSGCGKSTLMRLLLGFEKPDSGEIYYDDKPFGGLDLSSVRRKIGTVLQNDEIIQGTIFSNITVAGSNQSMDAVWKAAEFAGIADDIRKMPMGMNTMLTDGGGGVSGGQKQRILIARAILGKPTILFFDEATSALDNLTQKSVTQSLGEMNCTRVVIAHRLSTIENCDRIFCLDKGKVIEEGAYDELMAKNGFFTELVKRQQI